MKSQSLIPYAYAYAFAFGALLGGIPACSESTAYDLNDEDDDGDGKADSVSVVTDANLNGMWVTKLGGTKLPQDTVIESWPAVGIRLHLGDKVYQLTRNGNKLSGTGVSIDVKPNNVGVKDDVLEGSVDGKTIHLDRDVSPKATITVEFPADRPFRSFLNDTLVPLTQQDRESYVHMSASKMLTFLTSCELWKHGAWQRAYMKGADRTEQDANFRQFVSGVDGLETSPRQITSNLRFSNALKDVLKDQSKIGLAMSTFGMYFTTSAGRALRMPLTSDSMAYFVTDKPSRAEKIGVVVMDTPSHGPLASTFGRQLLDMAAMPTNDSHSYAQAMMDLLVKSDAGSASMLSGVGQSALTDWYAVMAIEDYRGVAFGNPDMGWGYNMTNVQFFGLVTRALAHPDQHDSAGHPIVGQVIVGDQLKPGDASYADVLNNGNDMQEYPDMARLKTLTTAWLRSQHSDVVAAVEAAFATVVPKSELDSRAQQDIFHYITAQLYDSRGRTATLTGAKARAAISAVVGLFDTLSDDSASLETYILAHGITKNNDPAPKSTGF